MLKCCNAMSFADQFMPWPGKSVQSEGLALVPAKITFIAGKCDTTKSDAMEIDLAKHFFQVHGINEQTGTCSTQWQLTPQGTYSDLSPASRPLGRVIN